ncbi:MAG: hypothetical protein JOZ39_13000 [Chloroflexi bacterium]|nr:hypothetical protein [Chloroflexota bacterium]
MTSVLIANRGEIACRLVQACHELGYEAVTIHVHEDRLARHVQLSDRSVAVSSYLNVDEIAAAAVTAKVHAVHPGYGFLSENPLFAEACLAAGLVFAGPSPDVIRLLGDKLAAKRLAAEAGLPLVPGSDREDAAEVGFPLLIKAAAGGGGKGMRSVRQAGDFEEALAGAKREAEAAFGDGRVFLERLIEHGRHVEVQVFGDQSGRVIALGERDCSIQRRYQKLVEESPAPGLDLDLREELARAAVRVASAARYVGPGTVEFLVDGVQFYFLEMNTRLQVEHPVTELVTGLDLAKLQLKVAFGEPLPGEPPPSRGHAIEVRVYAEDPTSSFLPSTGRIARLELPNGPGIRNDTGIQLGDEIGIHFDPMLAKLIVWGADRHEALARLHDALRRYCVLGVTTNLPFLMALLQCSEFQAALIHTRFLDEYPDIGRDDSPPDLARAAAAWRSLRRSVDPFRQGWQPAPSAERTPDGGMMYEGRRYYVLETDEALQVWRDGRLGQFPKPRPLTLEGAVRSATAGSGMLVAPMNGVVRKVLVNEGASVESRQTLVVLEAMKMEHSVQAPFAGIVRRLEVKPGDVVTAKQPLAEIGD